MSSTSIGSAKITAIAAYEQKLEADRAIAAVETARVTALRQKVQADQADQFVSQQNSLRGTSRWFRILR